MARAFVGLDHELEARIGLVEEVADANDDLRRPDFTAGVAVTIVLPLVLLIIGWFV